MFYSLTCHVSFSHAVLCRAQVSDTASSVVHVDVSVNPQIDAILDVDKVGRLLCLVQVLTSLLPPPQSSPMASEPAIISPDHRVVEVQEQQASSLSSYATADSPPTLYSLKKRKKTHSKSKKTVNNSDRYGDDMDNVTCLLELHMSLPCINLELIYDNSTALPSSVDISLQQVMFTLMNRGYDMHLQFELGMVQIRDSLRATNQACIVRSLDREVSTSMARSQSKTGGNSPVPLQEKGQDSKDKDQDQDQDQGGKSLNMNTHQLIVISVQLIKSNRSPLYDPTTCCGCIVDAEFGQLFLLLDTNSFLHFRPFYEVLMSQNEAGVGGKKEKTPAKESDILQSESDQNQFSSSSATATATASAVTTDGQPSGFALTLVFQELSLSLLQQNNYNYTRKVPLNQIFSFSFRDLTTDVQISTYSQMRADVNIRTISLFDTRDNSQNFYFKTVLRPMIRDADHAKHGHYPPSPKTMAEQEPEEKGNHTNVVDLHGTTDQLSLLFEQSDATTQQISVILRSLCIYVSMDVLMEMVGASMELVNAILQLIQPMDEVASVDHPSVDHPSDTRRCAEDKDGNTAEEKEEVEVEVEVEQKTQPPPSLTNINLSVSVKVPNPQLIFLEDPTTEHSKAIVFRSNLDCTLTKYSVPDHDRVGSSDSSGEGGGEDLSHIKTNTGCAQVVQSIDVSIYDMEFFMLSDMASWQPHQILAPVRIETGISQTFMHQKLTTVSCCINVDVVKMSLSLNDIVLMQSILMRRSLSSPPSTTLDAPRRKSPSAAHPSGEKAPTQQEPTQLFLVKAVLNMRTTTFALVNDFHGYNTPILQVGLEETAFKLDGFVQDMTGSGFVTLKVDYFNPSIVEWEPLVETWQPEFELSSNSQEVNVTAVAHQTLQLNITSTFLETVSSTYAMLVTQNSMSTTTASRQTPPTITFVNQLGIAVSLFDHYSHDCLFVLDPRAAGTADGSAENKTDKSSADDTSTNDVTAVGQLFVGNISHSAHRQMQSHGLLLSTMVTAYPDYIDVHIDDTSFTTDHSVLSKLGTTQINSTTTCPVVELSLAHLQAALVASGSDSPSGQSRVTAQELPSVQEPKRGGRGGGGEEKGWERVQEETFEYERYNPMIFSKGW